MNAPRVAAVLLLAALAACSPRRIPGTEILDNPDTRAIVAVLGEYQAAVEKRDAAAVLALVSPTYYDEAGTPDPADDLDYAALKRQLPEDLARVSGVRMEIKVSDVKVEGDKAWVFARFEARYRVSTRSGEVPKSQSDVNRLLLVREGGAWKIASGL